MDLFHSHVALPLHILPIGTSYSAFSCLLWSRSTYRYSQLRANDFKDQFSRALSCFLLSRVWLPWHNQKGHLGAKVFRGTERYASKNSLDKAIVTVKFDVCPKCASFTADIFSNLDPTTRYTISILARNLQVFPALHSHHKYLIFTLLAIMGDPLNLLSVILRTRCITVAPRCRRISSRLHRHLSDSADYLL